MGLCQRPNIAKRVLVVDNGLLLSGIRKLAVIPCYSPGALTSTRLLLMSGFNDVPTNKNPKKKTDPFIKAHHGKL